MDHTATPRVPEPVSADVPAGEARALGSVVRFDGFIAAYTDQKEDDAEDEDEVGHRVFSLPDGNTPLPPMERITEGPTQPLGSNVRATVPVEGEATEGAEESAGQREGPDASAGSSSRSERT